MWDLGYRNRGIFVLISVLGGCAILYNAWGPILALIVSIIFVIYVCYSLLTNDTTILLAPLETFSFIKYSKDITEEINNYLNTTIFYISSTIRKLYIILNNNYRIYVASKMNRYRQNNYQLSNDSQLVNTRNTSRFDLTTNQLSPISRNDYRENIFHDNQIRNDYSDSKLTSTPIVVAPSSRKDGNILANGVNGVFTPTRYRRQETHAIYGPNQNSIRSNETVFSPEGSPWGTSISPKIRSKAVGVKTVQTVAGPLLASTRYNIDPKVYSDVTSPGLSTRLAKYATEANSKLTHQSQYATGQFPKVNLNASPLPLISVKNTKMRTPVTVRIAPPEASRYSPPERQKVISDVCRAESRASPSVVQVLREISLKRHASREDVSAELVKKQRTEGLFDENLETLEETKQKRTREDSPNTEEEILARNNQLRPVKKTKTPSCFDVLNSLSSSNQYSSGVKRKASTLDLSRSGTPDIEKHFKASEAVQNIPKVSVNVTEPQTEIKKQQKHDLNEKSSPNQMEIEVYKKLREQPAIQTKSILKSQAGKNNTVVDQQQDSSMERHTKIEEKKAEIPVEKNPSPVRNKPVNFTDKLFMKAEPQTNERLRTLIQEQGNIRAKFTTDDVDEIKKEDIVNMRKTSMRARLQSMFDAISGKPSKKINPDVIIHAEGASEPNNTSQATPASLVTLSSTTSTTNVNTSPIATSALAPTVTDLKLGGTPSRKHVTFNLPSTQSSAISQNSSTEAIAFTGVKTNATESGKVNPEAPKLSFGTLVSTTTISTPPEATGSTTISFSSNQNANATGAVPSTVNSNITPSSFIVTPSSMQSSTQVLGTQGANITSATNSNLNLQMGPPTSTVTKGSTPNSGVSFTSTTPSTANMPPSALTSGNFTSGSNKSLEPAKNSIQTSPPMPNFSFGASKTSNTTSIFDGNVKTTPINSTNQTATTNGGSALAVTPSFGASGMAQTQQSAFNAASTTGGATAPGNTVAATSSSFQFGGGICAPLESAGKGSFSFTANANTGKSPMVTFGSTSAQGTPAFGGATTTQNPPSFASTISYQGMQSAGNSTATTTQNAPLFGGNLNSNQNPPAFGSAVTTAQNAATFGTPASSAAPPPAFGNSSTASTTFGFGNTAAAQTSTVSAFGTNTNSTVPSAATTSTTNPTFSFGSSATSGTKSGFAFGSNTPATTASNPGIAATGTSNQTAFGGAPGNNMASVFGTPSTTAPPAFGATPTTAPPAFGSTPTTAPPAFGASSTTAPPAFGASSSTTASVFGGISTTATPTFGATSSTSAPPLFGSTATTTTSAMFDGAVNQSTFGSVSSSGVTSGFGTPKTTAPPAFGSHTSESGFNYGGGSMGTNALFSGTSLAATSNRAAPPTAASTFGGNSGSKNLFGPTAKSPPSFAASTSANFGSSGAPSFGNPSGNFGSNGSSIPASNASGFGTQSSAPPAFGNQNQTVKQTPQGPPPAFGSTNSAFGSTTTAPPAFGANTATSSGFGSSAATFGQQNTTAPPSFGAATANAPPAFGATVSTPFGGQGQSSTSTFGAQNSTAPSFGATNNNPSATFGFGDSQTQQQQNSGFSFTGTTGSTNNNATTATPFQFGSTAATSEGFNFNASTTTPNMNFGATAPPSFGAPTQGSNIFGTASPAAPAGGMFSIGAGSTAPRSRSSRATRRQR